MKDLNLSQRVKNLRNQSGMTQELLAENSGLSLRTIQRIENNETVPRGDSLKRLAIALNTTPDEIIDWKIQEDKGYLILMSLSALGFLFFPILGIIIPLIFWILKKDKLKNVNELGKSILNFEITWSMIYFSYFILLFTGVIGKFMTHISPVSILKIYIPVMILYTYNIVIVVINTIKISRNKKTKYIPAIKFFR
ncbi:helix-turn-helix domain-containing protein [Tamlana sp. 2201CG12-4]|uniref:helix-turn-helix domain-containing protein n=1 Tax=Tamlana sp. 2201CG12-4 TaxID=3112582 RepID=UPI002DB86D21|nr:helix-turn-helix domain-containing protein [Tamlana sp. 2201CG12-4]MEC3906154.1 helix-turn-helix domain-containing protein [Tamlana sp. 2201CG12-4]